MKKKLFAAALTSMLMSGCASIVSDSNYPVAIGSSPSDANFIVTNKDGIEIHSGRTPATVSLKSGSGYFSGASYTVVFKKEGFDDKSFVIESTMDGWYWGNILFGGILGLLVIDPITGAMWKLPESQSISLSEAMASSESGSNLTIVSINDLPESDRRRLIKLN